MAPDRAGWMLGSMCLKSPFPGKGQLRQRPNDTAAAETTTPMMMMMIMLILMMMMMIMMMVLIMVIMMMMMPATQSPSPLIPPILSISTVG